MVEKTLINENNLNSRKIGMLTDVGKVRTIDEDSILAADLSFGINSESEKFLLLAVADGMGGHAKGEEASKIALNPVCIFFLLTSHSGCANNSMIFFSGKWAKSANQGLVACKCSI